MNLVFYLFRLHPLIMALLLLWRFVLPLSIKWYLKLPLGLVVSLCCCKLYVYYLTGGTMMDPLLSRYPAMLVDVLGFAAIMLLLLTIGRDLINVIFKLITLRLSTYIISPHSQVLGTLFIALSLLFGLVGTWGGFSRPELARYSITIDKLPPQAEGYRIVLLADLHVSSPTSKEDLEYIYRGVQALKPDLIVLAGDYQDGEILRLDDKTATISALQAPDGVYAVSGNHEFYSGYLQWLDYYQQKGLQFLENRAVTIRRDGAALFNLAGLMDKDGARFGFEGPNLDKALSDTDPNLPTILLSHHPEYARLLQDKVDLYLAGHTHGGMAPGLRTLVAALNGGMVSGLYKLGRERVIVSNGTMIWHGFALRIDDPPQVIEITLHSRAATAR
ncbi:MAG: metallophosphoesterase [Succinivibrio sp.]|nr:metallophosphoesterase [Succinivibrio sp.]